jgi:Na+-translocating ferredoxin:NAD+ oxidoreductase subunit E
MSKASNEFIKGLWKENPVLVLLLGLCPALAVTSSAYDGLGMGLAMTTVLLGSNIVVSLIRSIIPKKVRIPCFIVIIATFVTLVDMILEAALYNLHRNLGLFIPLIVVNCIILGRAEAFASKNKLSLSLLDALGMGLGFTITLFALGAVREILGNGTLTLFQHHDTLIRFQLYSGKGMILKSIVFILPPGAFISLGFFVAGMNAWNARKKKVA